MNNSRRPHELTYTQLQALQQRGQRLRSQAVLHGLRWIGQQLRLTPTVKHNVPNRTALQH